MTYLLMRVRQGIESIVCLLRKHLVLHTNSNLNKHIVLRLGLASDIQLLNPQREPSNNRVNWPDEKVKTLAVERRELPKSLDHSNILRANTVSAKTGSPEELRGVEQGEGRRGRG